MGLPQAARWKTSSDEEIASLHKHGVFSLVPISSDPAGYEVIDTRWVFKFTADSTYKSRLVVQGDMFVKMVPGYETNHESDVHLVMKLKLENLVRHNKRRACRHRLRCPDVLRGRHSVPQRQQVSAILIQKASNGPVRGAQHGRRDKNPSYERRSRP